MNQRNYDIFFNPDSDENGFITLETEDGSGADFEIVAHMEIEEDGSEYVAANPLTDNDLCNTDELIILEYFEDEDGDPQFAPIEDEELYEELGELFAQQLSEIMEEDEDDDSEYTLADDISEYLPGITIDTPDE